MADVTQTERVIVAGKSDIYVGFHDNYDTLVKLGEQENETVLTERPFFNDVHGDRHGGTSGPPIEVQFLGKIMSGQLRLSRFNLAMYRKLQRMCGAQATEGKVLPSEVGTLLLGTRALRVVISPTKANPIETGNTEPGNDYFFYNFPTVILRSPIVCNQGSKNSILQVEFEAHATPAAHAKGGTKEGVLWDRDDTGHPSATP